MIGPENLSTLIHSFDGGCQKSDRFRFERLTVGESICVSEGMKRSDPDQKMDEKSDI
jgi:hypothetical protein